MFAIVETGGKQYKVAKDTVILAELIKAKDGQSIKLNKVLLVKEGNSVHVGTPYIKGATVTCEVLSHLRQDKVVAFKYRKRKSSKKKIGHRQNLIKLKVKEIEIAKG
ncbi:MAG: 50S ribosomal protein L21 [Candidatus Omnitrophica bacterium]|nr:50S ribosomal protein L21 [Candidatus Omnitrophota bacterium]